MFEHEAIRQLEDMFEGTVYVSVHGWEPGEDGRSYWHAATGSGFEVTRDGKLVVTSECWMTRPYEFDLRYRDPFEMCREHLLPGLTHGTSSSLKRVLPSDAIGW